MQNILVLGAGLSSTSLIKYLLDHSKNHWKVRVGDIKIENAQEKIQAHPNGEAILFDVFNVEQCRKEIELAHIVISMLPARMHHLVAEACVKAGRNMVTASYLSPAIRALDEAAESLEKDGLSYNREIDIGISSQCRIERRRPCGNGTGGVIASACQPLIFRHSLPLSHSH